MKLIKSLAKVQRAANRVFLIPILALEVTNRCNSGCVMCEVWKNAGSKEPDGGGVERLVLGMKKSGLRHILVTGGEPLVRKDIFEFCHRLSRHGVKLILNTNGLLLEEHAKEVSWCFDLVIVSLDSHNRAGYTDIRGCDGFPSVIAGIRALKKWGGRVMLSHTLQKRNVHGVADFVAFSRTLNVDRVSVRPVDAFSHAFGRDGPQPDLVEELIPDEEDIGRFSNAIEVIEKRNRADVRRGYLKPGIQGFEMIRDYFSACRGRRDFPKRECDMPFVSLTVEAGGGVKPCFFLDPFSNVYKVDWSRMGIIAKSQDLAEIRRLYKKGRIRECRRCVQPYSADF